MRASDSPYITDWFLVSLRWLFLLGLILALALGGQLLILPNLLLVGWVCWNIAMTLLAVLNRRLPRHREINLGFDLLIAGLYFVLAGGFASTAFWIVFLPLITASLYFELVGALISVILMVAVQVGVTVTQTITQLTLLILGSSVFLTILIAGGFSYISLRLMQINRQNRQNNVEEEQKKRRVENDRLRAIYGLTSALTANLNYQHVLETVLDLSLSILNLDPEAPPDDRLICTVMLFSKEETLEVGSARRLTQSDLRVVLHGRQGVIAEAWNG